MKEKILKILEKHYHGVSQIENRCADEILSLLGNNLNLLPFDMISDLIVRTDNIKKAQRYNIKKIKKKLTEKEIPFTVVDDYRISLDYGLLSDEQFDFTRNLIMNDSFMEEVFNKYKIISIDQFGIKHN